MSPTLFLWLLGVGGGVNATIWNMAEEMRDAREQVLPSILQNETHEFHELVSLFRDYVKTSGSSEITIWDYWFNIEDKYGMRPYHKECERMLEIARSMHRTYGCWVFNALDVTGLKITYKDSAAVLDIEIVAPEGHPIERGRGYGWH